jgi:predicted alpha-1,2-mannosidase
MKLFSAFIALVIVSESSAQIKSVDALRDAQTKRPQELSQSTGTNSTRSKSLYVNPFIGTGGHGHTFPGATAPFGMMQLSPDTRHDGWDGCSGYHYSDSILYGFSHTHLSGTGVPDYCDLLIVPQTGTAKSTPGYVDSNGYGSTFRHSTEKASPGYYEVFLEEPKILARLSASTRSGMHEYTFNTKNEKRFIIIDLDHRDKLRSASIKQVSSTEISGYRISESWAKEQHFYFFIQTSSPFLSYTSITDQGQHKVILEFPDTLNQLKLKVGMSAVDEKGAENNLKNEISHWNLDELRAETNRRWNRELEKISIESSDRNVLINFYTALYHSFLSPNIFSDVDGRYRGRDLSIHQLKETEAQYSVFSLWDTYRATHPLFTLVQQKRTNDFVETFMRQYKQGGDLPVWELAANETECMIGYHSVSVIADAFVKGIVKLDTTSVLEAMLDTSTKDEFAKKSFSTNGFVNSSEEPESVSKTLEYAYDDFCIAQFAKKAGRQSIYDQYLNRSMQFINCFDPKTKFMRARRNGVWFSPFDPAEVNFNYTEANSWQYSLYAPHAIGTLTALIGSKDSLEHWLDKLFSTKSELTGRQQVDITGLIGQYAHGNEPSHHMAYLYNYTNAPYKTQRTVDRILKEMYSPLPDGLSGNEDCGQMSSWYVLSALGIYQIAPGSPIFDIGRPLIDKAIIKLENNNMLNINILNNSKNNIYIQSIQLNGAPVLRNYLTFDELNSGGNITITMGDSPLLLRDKFIPNPTISAIPASFVPVPFIEETSTTFEDQLTISLNYPKLLGDNSSYKIQYSFDGNNWSSYTKPIKISTTTSISAQLIKKVGAKTFKSPIIQNQFTKRDKTVHLTIQSNYANQYAAGGQNALIDGVRGGKEFRTGDWQGYWAQDMIGTIDFDTPRSLNEIGLSCIQDMKSWIFFPSSIELFISEDGKSFHSAGVINVSEKNTFSEQAENKEFTLPVSPKEQIKAIRLVAKNFGKCPEWHLGKGNDTWLFADEIIFR